MSNEAEVARMHAQLDADLEMASVKVVSEAMVLWMRSPEGKRKIAEAQVEVTSRWEQILEMEKECRSDS